MGIAPTSRSTHNSSKLTDPITSEAHYVDRLTVFSNPLSSSTAARPVNREQYYEEEDEGPSALEAGLAVGAVAVVGAAIGAVVGGIFGYKRGRQREQH